jgi:hypothetical protein
MTYNADGSDFWLLAKSLSRKFEDRYRKIKQECTHFIVSSHDACFLILLILVHCRLFMFYFRYACLRCCSRRW